MDKDKKSEGIKTDNELTQAAQNSKALPPITFDAVEYARYLDGFDMTEEQKLELLHAVFSIVLAFVDLGFGIHPVQQACGQEREKTEPSPASGGPVLESSSQNKLINEFARELEDGSPAREG